MDARNFRPIQLPTHILPQSLSKLALGHTPLLLAPRFSNKDKKTAKYNYMFEAEGFRLAHFSLNENPNQPGQATIQHCTSKGLEHIYGPELKTTQNSLGLATVPDGC